MIYQVVWMGSSVGFRLMHMGYASCARRIHALEEEVQRWSTSYTKATEATLHANQENQGLKRNLREELGLRATAEDKLVQTGEDLASVTPRLS